VFAVRVLGDKRLQFAHERRVPSQGKVGIDASFHCRHSQLVESAYLGLSKWFVHEVCQRGPTPQRQRVVEQGGTHRVLACDDSPGSLLYQPFEPVNVDLVRLYVQ
jgi:hypothetical protein